MINNIIYVFNYVSFIVLGDLYEGVRELCQINKIMLRNLNKIYDFYKKYYYTVIKVYLKIYLK